MFEGDFPKNQLRAVLEDPSSAIPGACTSFCSTTETRTTWYFCSKGSSSSSKLIFWKSPSSKRVEKCTKLTGLKSANKINYQNYDEISQWSIIACCGPFLLLSSSLGSVSYSNWIMETLFRTFWPVIRWEKHIFIFRQNDVSTHMKWFRILED